jgi:hypothetical protein
VSPRNAVVVLGLATLLGSPLEAGDEQQLKAPPPPVSLELGKEASREPALALVWIDATGCGRQAEGVARAEARSILEAMGLRPTWRRGAAGEPARAHEIQVVLVDRLLVDPGRHEPVLGATPRGARTYPVLWIHVPGVRATLGLGLDAEGTPLPARDRRALGVALGRVIAHEVVHVLAPGLAHGRGLMARALTPRELTAPRLSLEPGVALVVRAAMRGAPPVPPAAPGILAVSGSAAPVRLFAPRLAAEDGLAADELRLDEGAPQ